MHGRHTIRMNGWDYQGVATYLVTLVVEHRAAILGRCIGGVMRLSDAGRVVREELLRTPLIRRETFLDTFAVMPDHLHFIVRFDRCARWPPDRPHIGVLQRPARSLGALVWGFKSATTKRIRELLPGDFPPGTRIWQRNYHERILRTDDALVSARRYVLANPAQWRPRHRARTA